MLRYRVELQIIHEIMNMTKYDPGKLHHFDLKYMAFDIFPIGDDNLTAGPGSLIKVSQVQMG